jgi:hypothetical protein
LIQIGYLYSLLESIKSNYFIMLLVQKQLIEALQNGLSSLFQIQANDLVLQETKKEFEGSYTFVVFPFTKQAGLAPAAIAEKHDGEPGKCALVLLNGLQIGEQLAGVELVAQRVDNGHGGAGGHLFETRLRERAPDDRGDLALEYASRVGDALLAG